MSILPTYGHQEREAQCERCLSIFTARAGHAKYCPTCKPVVVSQQKTEAARSRRLRRIQEDLWINRALTLVYDPTGDFHPGAQFSRVDVVREIGYGVWQEGSRFRGKDGGLYVIYKCRLIRDVGRQ